MKKLIYIIFLFSITGFGQSKMLLASLQQAGGSCTGLNASNPNSEIILDDASATCADEANVVGDGTGNTPEHNGSSAAVSAVSETSSGSGDYVIRATPSSTGSLRRDFLDLVNGTFTSGEIYEVFIRERHSDTTGDGRYYISLGSSDGNHSNTHAAHTDWQTHSFEFTSNGSTPRIDICCRNSTTDTGQWVEFKISVKLKND